MIQLLSTDKIPWGKLTKQEQKEFDIFAVNKMLSTNRDYIEVINYLQIYYNMPKHIVYKMYQDVLPNKSIKIDYVKINKVKLNKDLMKIMSSYYLVSESEVKEYLLKISYEEKYDILNRLGYDSQEIKKLLKDESR